MVERYTLGNPTLLSFSAGIFFHCRPPVLCSPQTATHVSSCADRTISTYSLNQCLYFCSWDKTNVPARETQGEQTITLPVSWLLWLDGLKGCVNTCILGKPTQSWNIATCGKHIFLSIYRGKNPLIIDWKLASHFMEFVHNAEVINTLHSFSPADGTATL